MEDQMKKICVIGLLVIALVAVGCSNRLGRKYRRDVSLYDEVGVADEGMGYMLPEMMPEAYPEMNTDEFAAIEPNRFQRADLQPLSTFSIDVDTGGYSIVRKFLNDNELPPANAIRSEELINYFSYDYPKPDGKHPFSVYTELASCPWNDQHQLVHIGLKGMELETKDLPSSNLVFLIDVSGSMDEPNKLPLVQSSLSMLTDQLRENDYVSIVVYAGAAGLVLPPTSGMHKDKIKKALYDLEAGGSTAGGEGIQLAYKTAADNLIKEGNNRVILCSDGDFNVGISSTAELVDYVKKQRDSGIFISILGYGMGNYKDNRMEQIANQGNGNYAYIDDILEAKKVLVNEMSGTLLTIAKDVKIQVEFNPAVVGAYRLIGYENRMLQAEDFKDDTKDAGEMGAGHSVTALYEIITLESGENLPDIDSLRYAKPAVPADASTAEMLFVKLRYKLPDGDESIPLDQPLPNKSLPWQESSQNFRWAAAVAVYSMLLQENPNQGMADWDLVMSLAKSSKGEDPNGYRAEFIRLAEKASLMKPIPK